MMAAKSQVTARVLIEHSPDTGASSDVVVDTAATLPIVLPGGGSSAACWKTQRRETRVIAASDTGVAFTMPGDAVLVALIGDAAFKYRMATGEKQITTTAVLLAASPGTPLATGDIEFLVDGNGTTPCTLQVYLLSN